ncbi:MAG: DUF3341 domain-containing protein [Candidatus Brocadiae bacterium]|nr:DUF3341 domain-containing protein [Candidatus Brocadiia bacterium]
MQTFSFDTEQDFKAKLRELKAFSHKIQVITPYWVHDVEEILGSSPSPLKFFTLMGCVTGFVAGMGLSLHTVFSWPINTGGKPLVSLLPFSIVAYALCILLGGLFSFAGFLHLTRLPDITNPISIMPQEEYGNKFVILMEN